MFITGWRSRNSDDTTGYFFCPSCRARKPAAQGFRRTYLTVFFIPLAAIREHESYYRCEGCQNVFDPDADWPYDFGDHRTPKAWTCPHCHASNPSHHHNCQTCGMEA